MLRIMTPVFLIAFASTANGASLTCNVVKVEDDGRQRSFVAATQMADRSVLAFISSRVVDGPPATAKLQLISIAPTGEATAPQDLAGIEPDLVTGLASHGTDHAAAVWRSKEAVTNLTVFGRGSQWKRTDHQIGIPGFLAARVLSGPKGFLVVGHTSGVATLLRVSPLGVITHRFEIRTPGLVALLDAREESDGTIVFLGAGRTKPDKRALFAGRLRPTGEVVFRQQLSEDFHYEARLADASAGTYALFDEMVGGKVQVVSAKILKDGVSDRIVTPIDAVLAATRIGMNQSGDIVIAGFTKALAFQLFGRQHGPASPFERCTPALTGGRQDMIADFREIAPGLLAISHSSVYERNQKAHLRQLLKLISVEWQ